MDVYTPILTLNGAVCSIKLYQKKMNVGHEKCMLSEK